MQEQGGQIRALPKAQGEPLVCHIITCAILLCMMLDNLGICVYVSILRSSNNKMYFLNEMSNISHHIINKITQSTTKAMHPFSTAVCHPMVIPFSQSAPTRPYECGNSAKHHPTMYPNKSDHTTNPSNR